MYPRGLKLQRTWQTFVFVQLCLYLDILLFNTYMVESLKDRFFLDNLDVALTPDYFASENDPQSNRQVINSQVEGSYSFPYKVNEETDEQLEDFIKNSNKQDAQRRFALSLNKHLEMDSVGLIDLVIYMVYESFNLAVETHPYVTTYGPVERRETIYSSPALELRSLNIRTNLLEVLFRNPDVEVEDVLRSHEYFVVFLTIILCLLWILYKVYSINTSPFFHFDIMHLIPEAVGGSFAKAFEVGLKVLVGNATTPISYEKTFKEQLMSLVSTLIYSFSLGLVIVLAFYEARPTVIVLLMILIGCVLVSRLTQAFHLKQDTAEELLCDFTRLEIIQQNEAVVERIDTSKEFNNLRGSELNMFQKDCKIAEFVSQKKYIDVFMFVSGVMALATISEHVHRILNYRFHELYSHPKTFSIMCFHPFMALLIELFFNAVMFYISFAIYKIPTLSILTTSGQVQAATFFLQHFPVLTPYAYPGRSLPEPPSESIPRWVVSRRLLLHRMQRKLSTVQRPADAFHTCLVLLLTCMVLFSSQTDFFLYNEHGVAIVTIGLAGSLLLLAAVREAERVNKVIHDDQETVFWDAWSRTTLSNVEEKILTRPDILKADTYNDIVSFGGVAITPYMTCLFALILAWLWGAVFYQSIRCNERRLEILISDD